MSKITFKGSPVDTIGTLPQVGTTAPEFSLVKTDLTELPLSGLKGKRVILNIFPSLDTSVCAASVRRFNKETSNMDNTVVLCISKDLPFAHARFCTTEGIDNVIPLSVFRSNDFERNYGVLMTNGTLKGLLARAVVAIDENGKISYTELVPEITTEPNYEKVISFLK